MVDVSRHARSAAPADGSRALEPIRQKVVVDFSYPVHFTHGLFAGENPLLASVLSSEAPVRLLVVIDSGVDEHRATLRSEIELYCSAHGLPLACPPLVVPGGERVKSSPETLERIYDAVNEHGVCRHSYVVAVGGGAVLDAAGFAVATAHRGIRLVRVPTTVLAQNDSGVGVKNGLNLFGKKNFVGTFAPPWAVLNDLEFLTTLSDRDWRSGISEAVKVALLKDPAFFAFIEQNANALRRRDLGAMEWLVYRGAELHLQHIATSGDPFELGTSRPLDFGHWSAHKLERLSDYSLRHGEAVAIGLALDSTYSRLTGLLSESEWSRILEALLAVGLPIYSADLEQRSNSNTRPAVLAGLDEFREHLGGELTITLLQGIGRPVEVHELDEAALLESIAVLASSEGARPKGGSLWPIRPTAAR